MVSHEQCYSNARAVIGAVLTLAVLSAPAFGQQNAKKFYPDDPLLRDPPPLPVKQVAKQDVDDLYDFLENSFVTPRTATRIVRQGGHPALDVNTLGDVPDSAWDTNPPLLSSNVDRGTETRTR